MAAVNKIAGPVAPPPSPEEAVETHRVDTEQATAAKAALFRLFANATLAVPDWTDHCAALSLLPSRASQNHDYEVLKSLREHQARYVDLLFTTKENYFDEAKESDLEAVKHMLRRESQTLSLLETRLEIYETDLQQVAEVAFNEQRLAANHSSRNDTEVRRAVVTFKQAKMLVEAVLREELIKDKRLIVDVSKISPWHNSRKCYLELDVFESGTMQVQKKMVCTPYVQLKYLEASWPGALVAHRIEPLHGSMNGHTEKAS